MQKTKMQGIILTKSKHSQENIITLVLLIVISLAAVIIVWNIIKPLIEKSAGKVGTEALTVSLEIQDAKLWVTGGAEVKVHRGAGKGEITELKFVFEKADGDSEIVTTSDSNDIPGELETKTIEFTPSELPFNNSEISKVSLAPIFGNNAGIQVYELESEIQTDPSGERILDAPADNSLVSWWKFDEGSGNIARDSINNNDGTINGASFVNDAERGNVLSFDGMGDYVSVPNLNIGTAFPFTLSAWVKPETTGDYRAIIGYDTSHRLLIYTTGRMLSQQDGDFWSAGSGNVPNGVWTHVMYWNDGAKERWYINGASIWI